MSFIDLDCHPETVIAFNDTEGGKGALWIATYSARVLGVQFAVLTKAEQS